MCSSDLVARRAAHLVPRQHATPSDERAGARLEAALIRHHGGGDGARPSIEYRFARVDKNEDGVLTEDEVPPQIWERLLPADTDGDGGIALDELVAFNPERDRHGPRTHLVLRCWGRSCPSVAQGRIAGAAWGLRRLSAGASAGASAISGSWLPRFGTAADRPE